MKTLPLRFSVLAFLAVAGSWTPAASAQSTDATRLVESAHTDDKGRHLAPHDTFYMLNYVAVKTDKGVEGFNPGQEVHLVEVHRPTHTLVVTDGHAQVEVPPSQLTNDLEVAAAVRQKDEAGQARVAAYIDAEKVAYQKFEREAADATAKDLERARQEKQAQAAELRKEQQTPVAETAPPVYSNYNNGGYYGDGGYGYGSPYGYFTENTVVTGNAPSQAPAAAPAAGGNNPAATSTSTGKVAAPAVPAAAGKAR